MAKTHPKQYLSTEAVAELAKDLHQNQKLKNGKNYFGHILSVVENVKELFPKAWPRKEGRITSNYHWALDVALQSAYLHDSLEDCCEESFLERSSVDPLVICIVRLLTKVSGPTFDYGQYLKKIKANPIARIVKMADLEHNSKLSRASYIPGCKESRDKLVLRHVKYLKSYLYLSGNY
jgi:(p)ppGpp synthase/HD superfamily hydrolase